MSRIYRSLDLKKLHVEDLDLTGQPMGVRHVERPQGGFAGCDSGEGGEGAKPAMSHRERQQWEAERVLEEARRQAEVVQRDAYHAGFAQGERAGEKLAAQKIEPTLQAFQGLIAAIDRDRDALLERHREDLIKIAFAIATRIVRTTVEMQPDVVNHIVEEALRRINRAGSVKIRTSPHDRQLIDRYLRARPADPSRDSGSNQAGFAGEIPIESDESVGRGGCILEIDSGEIDADIAAQLRALKDGLWKD